MIKINVVLAFIILVLGACSPALPPATPTVEPTVVAQLHLSELDPVSVSVGFSELGKGVNPWTEESLVKGETITIQKTPYPYGLFSHAPAKLEYTLNGKYLNLSGKALMHDGLQCGDGVVFRILVDGREVFTSPTLTATSEPAPFSVDLTNAQTLTLNADALKNNECDWSVWGDPVLTYLVQGSAPTTAGLSPTATFPENATSTPGSTQPPAPTAAPAPSATPRPTATPVEQTGWKPEGVVTRFGKGLFYNLAASPDETTVAIAAAGGIYLADPQTGKTTAFLETGGEPSDLAFSSDGSKLFVGIGDLGVEVWERSGQNTWTRNESYFPGCAYRLLVSLDDRFLVTYCLYSRNRTLAVWDLAAHKQLRQQTVSLTNKAPLPFAMAFAPNHPELLAIAANASVTLTEAATGKAQATYFTPKGDLITGLKFSPDGATLALITGGKTITLLNAQTLTETGKIIHQSEVFALSFLDNQKLVSINNGEYVLQQTDGRTTRKMSAWASPNHVYLPKSGLLALVNVNNLEFISLKDTAIRIVATVPGFVYKNWRSIDFSGDGQAFMGTLSDTDTNYLLSYASNPDRFKSYNANEVCKSEARWLNFFGNHGQYFRVDCKKANSLKIIDIKTMQTVFSSKSPLWVADNTDIYSNPRPDEAELLGLLYENPAGASAKFSVEIWEPLKNKKISTFDLNLKNSNSWLRFSPRSTLLAGLPRDPGSIQIHEVASGKLLQTIPDPSTWIEKSKNYYRYEMDDVDLLFLIERQNSVEVYSIQTGKLVRKFSNLGRGQLPEGISGANPTQGMAYFAETKTLVWYYVKNSSHGQTVTLDYYDIKTGEKRSSVSVEIPLDKQHPYFAESKALLGQVTHLYFHPEGQGKTAVVTATLQASTWLRNFILVIDFSKPEIVKTYSYFGNSGMFTPDQTPIVNGFMFQRNFDTIFKWDVSIEK